MPTTDKDAFFFSSPGSAGEKRDAAHKGRGPLPLPVDVVMDVCRPQWRDFYLDEARLLRFQLQGPWRPRERWAAGVAENVHSLADIV